MTPAERKQLREAVSRAARERSKGHVGRPSDAMREDRAPAGPPIPGPGERFRCGHLKAEHGAWHIAPNRKSGGFLYCKTCDLRTKRDRYAAKRSQDGRDA